MPLERHDLRHPDGRRLLIYGELRGTLGDERAPGPSEPASQGGEAADFARSGLHKRYDRLTETWIAVSPARNVRPDATRRAEETLRPGESGECPLCPGGPEIPFSYEAAVFENRFPALVAEPPPVAADPRVSAAKGACEVVVYTERHRGSLATLEPEELARVVAIWRDRSEELWEDPGHRFVLIFENRGDAVGATVSHPHGQIYAFDHVPPLIAARVGALVAYRNGTGECLSCRVVADDGAATERILDVDEHVVTAVPFAARWPFEVHVRARRHGARRLADLRPAELAALSGAIRGVVARYDRLFGVELPYLMVVLEAPEGSPDWHLGFEFYPPNRNERLLKIRASVESATGLFINDTLPDVSARRLQAIRVEATPTAPVPAVVPVARAAADPSRLGD